MYNWEFSPGDHISNHEVVDLDDDSYSEILLVTGNKVYTVEYQHEPPKTGGLTNDNEYLIILGPIVIHLVIMAIVLI